MTGRDKLHQTISDLLQTLNINNNRLSLHTEQLSELDVDVLRKQCIDLYETINLLPHANAKLAQSVPAEEEETTSQEQHKLIYEEEIRAQDTSSESVKDEFKEELEEIEELEEPEAPKEEVKVEIQEEENKSIHMKLQDEAEMVSLFEKFNSKPIDSIAKAITISKRFEFQNNFFDGDAKNYKEFIEMIDAAGEREAAFQIYHEYKKKLGWDNEDLKDELKSLLYRKYAT